MPVPLDLATTRLAAASASAAPLAVSCRNTQSEKKRNQSLPDSMGLIDTMVAVASAARGTGVPRHVEILAGLEQIVREEAARQNWALSEDETLELLGMDLELNAQGLGVWLDSRRVAEAETA